MSENVGGFITCFTQQKGQMCSLKESWVFACLPVLAAQKDNSEGLWLLTWESHTHIWSQSVIPMTHWHCLEQWGTLIETNCPVSLHSVNSASRGGGSGYTKNIPKQTFYGTDGYQPEAFFKSIPEFRQDLRWSEMKAFLIGRTLKGDDQRRQQRRHQSRGKAEGGLEVR